MAPEGACTAMRARTPRKNAPDPSVVHMRRAISTAPMADACGPVVKGRFGVAAAPPIGAAGVAVAAA